MFSTMFIFKIIIFEVSVFGGLKGNKRVFEINQVIDKMSLNCFKTKTNKWSMDPGVWETFAP